MNEYTNMTLNELIEAAADLFECGAEITTCRSAYETEEEFQEALMPVTAELEFVENLINQKENVMNNDRTMCQNKSKKGVHCKYKALDQNVMVYVNSDVARLQLRENAEPADWTQMLIGLCGGHINGLERTREININFTHIPNKEEDMNIQEEPPMSQGSNLPEGVTDDMVEYGMSGKWRDHATKRVMCGNCRKKGVGDPYHNSSEEVRECYGAPAKPVKSGYTFFDRDDKQAAIIHAKTTGGTFKSTKDRKGWVVIAK